MVEHEYRSSTWRSGSETVSIDVENDQVSIWSRQDLNTCLVYLPKDQAIELLETTLKLLQDEKDI